MSVTGCVWATPQQVSLNWDNSCFICVGVSDEGHLAHQPGPLASPSPQRWMQRVPKNTGLSLHLQQHPARHPQLSRRAVGNPGFHYFNDEIKLLCSVKSNPKPPCVYRKGSDRLRKNSVQGTESAGQQPA